MPSIMYHCKQQQPAQVNLPLREELMHEAKGLQATEVCVQIIVPWRTCNPS